MQLNNVFITYIPQTQRELDSADPHYRTKCAEQTRSHPPFLLPLLRPLHRNELNSQHCQDGTHLMQTMTSRELIGRCGLLSPPPSRHRTAHHWCCHLHLRPLSEADRYAVGPQGGLGARDCRAKYEHEAWAQFRMVATARARVFVAGKTPNREVDLPPAAAPRRFVMCADERSVVCVRAPCLWIAPPHARKGLASCAKEAKFRKRNISKD